MKKAIARNQQNKNPLAFISAKGLLSKNKPGIELFWREATL